MASIRLQDISLRDYGLTERVRQLRSNYFRALPEICVERPRLVTRYSLEHGLFNRNRISILDKAKLYRYVLENRTPIVRHTKGYEKGMKLFEFKEPTLFAGSTTGKFKGVPIYPEFLGLTIWPELWTISKRKSNPFQITEAEVQELNYQIFPHWIENNILELARKWCATGAGNCLSQMKLHERLVFFLASKPECISHTIPDFSKAVRLGISGIINEAKERLRNTNDPEKKEFYAAICEVSEGIITYSKRLASAAESLSDEEPDYKLKQELRQIAAVYRHAPEFPARSFREGLTTVWVVWTAVHLENPNVGLSLGRLDQLLYELYRHDIENGKINLQDAIELVCCLWLKIGDHVPAMPDTGEQLFGGTGSNQAITFGGVDKDGVDAVNDLTYVMLRATELLKLRDPNPNARYYQGINSRDYLRRLCEINIETGAIPAIHNDRAVINALTAKGETIEQARDYGVIGCVEPGSNGRFYGHTGAILLNLTAALELTLFNGRHRHTGMDLLISRETGNPVSFKTYDEFKAAFETQTRWLVEQAVTLNNVFGKIHQKYYPTPILSAFFEGPMEKGKDLIQGGAVINSSGAAIIGLGDVADSLSAIQRLVFEDKVVDFDTFLDAIQRNFEGYEKIKTRLLDPDKTPKYGNEDPAADANAVWIVEMLDRAFSKKENYRGGRYRVGYWSMTMHAGFGRLTKALPSGRTDGENFTSGITPVSGETPYLTKALNSVANLPSKYLSSGVALNMKYTPSNQNKLEVLDDFVASVEAYFDDNDGRRDGGMEIQFNVIDRDALLDIMKNPASNSELLVRVSGYTAYFKDLNPQMQKEIIDRTEYLLSTGQMIPHKLLPIPERRQ
jgi:formate C-acetyltransferase